MKIVPDANLKGDIVNLHTNSARHIGGINRSTAKSDPVTESFGELFNNAINEVNNLELKATELTNRMIVDPESVNIHDVQIAAEQAEMSVMFTKGLVDRLIRGYKEIINQR